MWRLGVAFRLLTTRSRASPLPAAFPGQGPPKSFVHCILFLRGAADRIRYLSEKKTHVRRAAQERGGPSGGAKQMPAVRLGATREGLPSGRRHGLARPHARGVARIVDGENSQGRRETRERLATKRITVQCRSGPFQLIMQPRFEDLSQRKEGIIAPKRAESF